MATLSVCVSTGVLVWEIYIRILAASSLSRVTIVSDARDKMIESRLLELVGPPGAGKSAILKALVENQRAEGSAIVLAGDRIAGVGWDGFAGSLQLTHSLG